MKKLISVILLGVLLLTFAACGKDKTESKTETTTETQAETVAPTETATEEPKETWYQIPDMDVVGTYQRVDDKTDTAYYIFSSENTIRYRSGSVTIEADVEYGVSKEGNRIGRSDGPVLYGNWTYGFEDNCLLVVYENGEQFKYSPVRYTPVELEAMEDFVKDDDLVGVWKAEDDSVTYEFSEDGFGKIVVERVADDEQDMNYTETMEFVYTTDYNSVTFETYYSNTEKNSIDVDYYVSGDTLTMDGVTFTRQN